MKRWMLIAGIAVLAVAALVIPPAYVTSHPAFFARYPGLGAEYEPWSESTHAEASCDSCHAPTGIIPQALHRTRMVGEFYLSLVSRSRVPQVFPAPTNEACLACHSDLRTVSPEGDLRIPHRAHVNILKMDCVACHDYLVHGKSPEGKHTPPMSGCLECHDGDTAKDGCTTCHTEKAAPATHRAKDWVVAHPKKAIDADCVKCHKWAEDWCADCHASSPRSHGADWRAVHGVAVAKHRSCEACHEARFCIRCHGELPKRNFDPALKLVR